MTLVAALVLLRGAQRWRALGRRRLAAVVFLVLLAPWSIAASRSLDARVVTTTTVPISLANTFGDREQVCFGKCDPDSYLWFRPLRYAREVGRATGESEVEVEKQMSDYALRDLDRRDYARQAWWNIGSYFFLPANFVRYIAPPDGRGPVGDAAQKVIWGATYVYYIPILLLTLLSMLFIQLRSLEAQILDTLTKIGLLALFVQPFVHVAGSRYWTTAGPLFIRRRRRASCASPTYDDTTPRPCASTSRAPTPSSADGSNRCSSRCPASSLRRSSCSP